MLKAAVTSASIALTALAGSASAEDPDLTAKSVVLVHGAFADGSAWSGVVPFLEQAGLDVISVQNPLDSLAGDVAFTNRAIARAQGPVVLVGHSWGGQVITEAGLNDKVHALVYVAAYAPNAGQSLGEAAELDTFPAPGIAALQQDDAGYFFLPDDAMASLFAHDVPKADADIMAATQGLLNSEALGQPVSHAAWEHKPSFYVIAGEDYMTPTALQRQFAKKIGATAREVDASHAVAVSQPKFVADMIIEAAK
ncbi:hypothetical protein CFI11_15180 [Thalassococcus sp. S3]|nr:hypothetical protein CFI11_15180 [Thalassococcus sp. S3]